MRKKLSALSIIFLAITLGITQVMYAEAAFKLTKEAVEFVAKSSRKTDLKLVHSSTQVKQGMHFETAVSVEKMSEATLSRTPLRVIEGLQKSAERATPVEGKPGWVKTFVGVGVFLTGADIGYEVFDMINGIDPNYDPNKIQRYTESFVVGTGDTIVGSHGLSHNWEYVTDRFGVTSAYLKLTSSVVPGAWWMVNTDGTLGYMSWTNAAAYHKDAVISKWEFVPDQGTGDIIFTVAQSPDGDAVKNIKLKGWYDYYLHDPSGFSLVQGPIPGVSKQPMPDLVTVPMTDAFADAYPNDSQLVEISYPDPATVTDPFQSIQSNQDAIREPSTEPGTDPGTNPENPTNGEKINWEPLKMIPGAFTKKFPFSIPWDIGAQLSVFNVEPVAPVLHVDKNIPVFGTSMRLKFDIDFSMFDTIAVVVRWFLIIAFDLGVILSIRKFMPE